MTDFLDRCSKFRDEILKGESFDKTLGWMCALGSQEAYDRLGNFGFLPLKETQEGDAAIYRYIEKDKVLEISFRGTVMAHQWFSNAGNLNIGKIELKDWFAKLGTSSEPKNFDCGPGQIAKGFGEAYQTMRLHLIDVFKEYPKKARVRLMGHSRGAVLAKLAALDLSCNFFKGDIDVVVFAGPRVGDDAFTSFYHSRNNIRMVNFSVAADPVPQVPLARWDDSICKLPQEYQDAVTGFEHIVVPTCLDEDWAAPVGVQVMARLIEGELMELHSMRTYIEAYKAFFQDPLKLGCPSPKILENAMKKRILLTFLACRQDSSLKLLQEAKEQHQNTQGMIATLGTRVLQDVQNVNTRLQKEEEGSLVAATLALKAVSQLYLSDCSHETKVSLSIEIVAKCQTALTICVKSAHASLECKELLLMVLTEVIRAQIITDKALTTEFLVRFETYMDYFKNDFMEEVLKKITDPKEAGTPLVSAWNLLYRQLSIIATFHDKLPQFRQSGYGYMLQRLSYWNFVNRTKHFAERQEDLIRQWKTSVTDAMTVLENKQMLSEILDHQDLQITELERAQESRCAGIVADLGQVQQSADTTTIILMGRMSAGKTTFVQALLQDCTPRGQQVPLPIDYHENTRAITILELSTMESSIAGVIAKIVPENPAAAHTEVKNWTDAEDILAKTIDKQHLANAVMPEEDPVPRVRIIIYGCDKGLTVIDTPGCGGLGCDYTPFLKNRVAIPMFLCSFVDASFLDTPSLEMLQQVCPPGTGPPPTLLFTKEIPRSIKNMVQRVDSLAEELMRAQVKKPFIGAIDAQSALTGNETSRRHIKKLVENLQCLGRAFQPILAQTLEFRILKTGLVQTMSEVLQHDSTKALIADAKDFKKFQNNVRDHMTKYVNFCVDFCVDFGTPGTQDKMKRLDVKIKECVASAKPFPRCWDGLIDCTNWLKSQEHREKITLICRQNSVADPIVTKTKVKATYAKEVYDLMLKYFLQNLSEEISAEVKKMAVRELKQILLKNVNLQTEFLHTSVIEIAGTGLGAGVCLGGATWAVLGSLAWWSSWSIAAGPIALAAGTLTGTAAFAAAFADELDYKPNRIVDECANKFIFQMHMQKEKVKDCILDLLTKGLDELFQNLEKLRSPEYGGAYNKQLEILCRLDEKIQKLNAEFTQSLQSINYIIDGDTGPTETLLASKFNAPSWDA
eukprot:TRINITY_DN48317_c0_g1_i1.p1 TRINITY_DN48317_c0_g1~~TRINITY_DN48317_c0_g1_i1.p1  ORF type:complete len:1191 (-),score=195.09 TRINITY_DN48317_c0_g1_i1:224-3796(-)